MKKAVHFNGNFPLTFALCWSTSNVHRMNAVTIRDSNIKNKVFICLISMCQVIKLKSC